MIWNILMTTFAITTTASLGAVAFVVAESEFNWQVLARWIGAIFCSYFGYSTAYNIATFVWKADWLTIALIVACVVALTFRWTVFVRECHAANSKRRY